MNTVPLVYQQGTAIENHTGLKVGKYEGSMGVDFWDNAKVTFIQVYSLSLHFS